MDQVAPTTRPEQEHAYEGPPEMTDADMLDTGSHDAHGKDHEEGIEDPVLRGNSNDALSEASATDNERPPSPLAFQDIQDAEAFQDPRLPLQQQITDANGSDIDDDVNEVLHNQPAYIMELRSAWFSPLSEEPQSTTVDLDTAYLKKKWSEYQVLQWERCQWLERSSRELSKVLEMRLWAVLKEVIAAHRTGLREGLRRENGLSCCGRIRMIAEVLREFQSVRGHFIEACPRFLNIPLLVAAPSYYGRQELRMFLASLEDHEAALARKQIQAEEADQPSETGDNRSNASERVDPDPKAQRSGPTEPGPNGLQTNTEVTMKPLQHASQTMTASDDQSPSEDTFGQSRHKQTTRQMSPSDDEAQSGIVGDRGEEHQTERMDLDGSDKEPDIRATSQISTVNTAEPGNSEHDEMETQAGGGVHGGGNALAGGNVQAGGNAQAGRNVQAGPRPFGSSHLVRGSEAWRQRKEDKKARQRQRKADMQERGAI